MMQFQYFRPRADIRDLVSSYYSVTVPEPVSDVMRAEIANVRFVIGGDVVSDINSEGERYVVGTSMLCGPTHKWSHVQFAPGAHIFGAAITPLGWARMFDVPASGLADRIVPLEAHMAAASQALAPAVFDARDEPARVAAADALFASLVDRKKSVHEGFLRQATDWITSPEANELEDLMAATPFSPRQVDRLCRKYFGCAPKRLHRKFRALHSANRLTWQELTDWRDVATTAYADQSHFIREFKQFNGRTPTEFINGAHVLVRLTLQERLQIDHESPFSLIG